MSADNWDVCPRCLGKARLEQAQLVKDVQDAYGKVSPDEYEALAVKSRHQIDPEKFRTFREDYEFWGASEGQLNISYRGSCTVCKLSKGFEHSETFYSGETP